MAGYQSPTSPLGAGVPVPQRSRFNLGGGMGRKQSLPSVQQLPPVQQQTAPQQRPSISSSQSSSLQKVKTAGTPGANSNIFGKTSGWYHGSNYDIADMWNAATIRDYDALKRCMKAGLNVNHSRWVKADRIVGTGARSIADVVACRNDLRGMRLLLENGVDLSGTSIAAFVASPQTQTQRYFLYVGDDKKLVDREPWSTPLHFACRNGNIDMVRIILEEAHIEPNTRDSRGRTSLHMTVTGKSMDIAKLLLDSGAAIEMGDDFNVTPLAAAACTDKVEMVQLFMDHGAFIDATDKRGETPLYNASLGLHAGVVTALATRGANLDVRNIDGMSAFFKAASALETDTMKLLTDCGADTDARDNNGCTALHRAAMAKNVPLLKYLLQIGVDIDAIDNDGWTPLFVAMIHNDDDLISLLLTHGSNAGKADHHGHTGFHQAAILGPSLVVRHLLTVSPHSNINPSQMSHFGETPLILACKQNHSPIVKILLKHGVNPHHVDPNGYRAIDRAMYWGSHACVRLLLEAGVVIDNNATLALQQGKQDNTDTGYHEMILNRLQSQYQALALPSATLSSQLRHYFARTITVESLCARMRQKQGKPPLDPNPPVVSKDDQKDEEAVSPDPFERCIPTPPPALVINNNTTNIKANGNNALEAGAAGASIALGITNTVLNNI